MAEDTDLDRLPRATVVPGRRMRISFVWIIPILAAVVAIGIAIQRVVSEGPTITIVFRSAEGIEAGKTFIKYKDVNIGQVTAVQLSEDYGKVEITAKIAKRAEGLIVEDAKFWIVRPRITLSGISGLGTLLSGNYIGFEAGKSAQRQRDFTGIEVPPILTGGVPGREFVLKAADLGSLGAGSPIYYRRLQVGQVSAYDLAPDGKTIDLKVFVNAPYDKYITPSTRFWNASGIDISFGTNGLDVRTESLVSLLAGGLAFDTPPSASSAESAAANTVFTVFRDRNTAMRQPDSIARPFVLYFNEPLRGLSVGAPVDLFGLPVGEVTYVGLTFDPATLNMRPRVDITFFPERLIARLPAGQVSAIQTLEQSREKREALLRRLVEERGLRAQLRTGSLLTGQMYVAFDYFPKAPKVSVNWSGKEPELPVVPGLRPDVEEKLTSILAKLDKLPLEAIGENLKNDLAALDQTLKSANKLVGDVDTQLMPQLKTDLEGLHRTLAAAERVMNNADATLLGPNAPVQQDLRDALQELGRAARSLRTLTDYLERHPESLIRGKTEQNSGRK